MTLSIEVNRILSKKNIKEINFCEVSNILIPNLMYLNSEESKFIKNTIETLNDNYAFSDESSFYISLILSLLLFKENKYEESISKLCSNELETELPKNEAKKFSIATVKGINYRSMGQHSEAFKYLHRSSEGFINNRSEEYENYLYLISLYNIGELNYELGNFEKMLNLHNEFYRLSIELNYPDMTIRAANGIGRANFLLEDNCKALEYLHIAEEEIFKSGNWGMKARNWHDLALVYASQNSNKDALNLLLKSKKIREEHNLNDALVSTLIEISNIHLKTSENNKALTYLKKAASIAERYNYRKKLVRIYRLLSSSYEQDGNIQNAFNFLKKHNKLKNELNYTQSVLKENEAIREVNTLLVKQKQTISKQKDEIESYVQKLEENNKSLQNFASIAAHDIKAPIRIISSFSGLISKKYSSIWDETDKEFLSFITENISKLSCMIDALLSLSRMDCEMPPPQAVDVHQIISEISERLKDLIIETKAEIKIPEKIPTILGHPPLIAQLFQNLIGNALKYRSELSPIIQISYLKDKSTENSKMLTFKIKDNGQGIDKEFHSKIFELFYGTNAAYSNGIGLATCKKIINSYGGKIWVDSKKGLGTSFYFTLPCK